MKDAIITEIDLIHNNELKKNNLCQKEVTSKFRGGATRPNTAQILKLYKAFIGRRSKGAEERFLAIALRDKEL